MDDPIYPGSQCAYPGCNRPITVGAVLTHMHCTTHMKLLCANCCKPLERHAHGARCPISKDSYFKEDKTGRCKGSSGLAKKETSARNRDEFMKWFLGLWKSFGPAAWQRALNAVRNFRTVDIFKLGGYYVTFYNEIMKGMAGGDVDIVAINAQLPRTAADLPLFYDLSPLAQIAVAHVHSRLDKSAAVALQQDIMANPRHPIRASNDYFTDNFNLSFSETWHTRPDFPGVEIGQYAALGAFVSAIAYGENRWAFSVSTKTGFSNQIWQTSANFPDDYIKRGWDAGYRITHLTNSGNQWLAMLAQGTDMGTQSCRTRSHFPADEIKMGWNEGKGITGLAYGNGGWAVVLSATPRYTAQRFDFISGQKLSEHFRDMWNQGYKTTHMAFGEDRWAVVSSQTKQNFRQSYVLEGRFPKDTIQEYWDKDYSIFHLAYGDKTWALLLTRPT